MLHFTSTNYPFVRYLSDDQIQDIHLATLEVLERTGVKVRDERALALLKSAGARINGDIAHIPAHLVTQAIATAPERVVVANRKGERVMPLEFGKVFYGAGSDTPNTIDIDTHERRLPVYQDVVNFALITDACPNLDFNMSMGIIDDRPRPANYVNGFAAMLEGSSKPILFTADNVADMEKIYKMACAVAGSEDELRANPFLLLYDEPISPLTHSPNGLAKLFYCAERNLPIAYVAGTMAGGNVPVSLAGALVVVNAECLSGLVIHQLTAPGAPFIYGANVSVIDMANSTCVYGGPEWRVTDAALADMARFYKLPVWAAAGNTDAKTVDAQAGAEAIFSITTAAMSRCNLVHDVGYIDSGLTSSLEMLLLADELIAMVKIYMKGIQTDKDRLALDLIHEIGPGGHFLDTDHTVKYFRTEHFMPKLIDRRNYDAWSQGGCQNMEQRLNAKVKDILASHKPEPLSASAKAVIAEVLASCS